MLDKRFFINCLFLCIILGLFTSPRLFSQDLSQLKCFIKDFKANKILTKKNNMILPDLMAVLYPEDRKDFIKEKKNKVLALIAVPETSGEPYYLVSFTGLINGKGILSQMNFDTPKISVIIGNDGMPFEIRNGYQLVCKE